MSLLCCLVPFSVARVDAVMPQVNYLGTITARDVANNMITIRSNAYQWVFGGGGWLPLEVSLEAEAPNSDTMPGIQVGDRVEASAIGEPGIVGDRWVSLARLKPGTGEVITDVYGDPAYLLSVLEGSYSFDYVNTPSCATCLGCWCEAAHAQVAIADELGTLYELDLYPGESHDHQGDPYCLSVLFHSGEANGYPICTDEACGGPQLLSDFTLHILHCQNPGWSVPVAQATRYGSRCSEGSGTANILTMCLLVTCMFFLLKQTHRR